MAVVRPPVLQANPRSLAGSPWQDLRFWVDYTATDSALGVNQITGNQSSTSSTTSGYSSRYGDVGIGWRPSSTMWHRFDNVDYLTYQAGIGGQFTLVCVFTLPSTSGNNYLVNHAYSGATDRYSEIGVFSTNARVSCRRAGGSPSGTNWAFSQVTFPSWALGQTVVLVGTFDVPDSGTGTARLYLNGVEIASDSQTYTSDSQRANRLTVGRADDSSPSNSTGTAIVHAVGAFGRTLTASEVAAVSADPWWPWTIETLSTSPAATELSGSLFQVGPTFGTGSVSPGSVGLSGSLLQVGPSFSQGSVGSAYDLAGSLFQVSPSFVQGDVSSGQTLTGALFQAGPAFPQGVVSPGAVDIAGSLFQTGPTFSTGSIAPGTVNLSGSLFQIGPTFPVGNLANAQDVEGVLFQIGPSFPSGDVDTLYDLSGSLFQVGPTFASGVLAPGAVDISGVLMQVGPSFFVANLTGGLRPRRRTVATAVSRRDGSSTSSRKTGSI